MNVPLARAVAVPAGFRHSGNPMRSDKDINNTPTWCQKSARQRLSVVPPGERSPAKQLSDFRHFSFRNGAGMGIYLPKSISDLTKDK